MNLAILTSIIYAAEFIINCITVFCILYNTFQYGV